MKLRARPPKGKTLRFLDLPAELRNTIYQMICSSDSIKLVRRSTIVPQAPPRRKEPRPVNSSLQLAHVNHQIRHDFLPIYYNKIAMSIHFNDAFTFVRAFLLPRAAHTSATTIEIDITGVIRDQKRAVDVYPLLKFFRNSPGASLDITQSPTREERSIYHPRYAARQAQLPDIGVPTTNLRLLLAQLTAPPKTPEQKKWAQYSGKYVTALYIEPSRTLEVSVVLRHAAVEYWMGHDANAAETEDWVSKTGFPKGVVYEYVNWSDRIVEVKWRVMVKGP